MTPLSTVDCVLIVLSDRENAERLAEELATDGWSPCLVHKELLAGEDDAEDADWVIELTTAPGGEPAGTRMDELAEIADVHEGFATSMN